MSWFSNLREIRQLKRDNEFWRKRASLLEKKVDELNSLLLERDFLWSDRFLTSKANTFAITDEANQRVWERSKEKPESSSDAELKAYLRQRHQEILDDAKEAGETEAAADLVYKQREQNFIEDFALLQGFE